MQTGVTVLTTSSYQYSSSQPREPKSKHLRIMRSRAHAFHPTVKTAGDLCFDCALSFLTSSQTQLWQIKMLLEKLSSVLTTNHVAVRRVFEDEKKTLINQFMSALLGAGLTSVSSVKETTLEVTMGLAELDTGKLSIRASIAKWLTSNTRQIDNVITLRLLQIIISGENTQNIINQYGDVTVSNILKGIQEPDAVLPALSCLSTLIDVYSVSQGHAKIILSELIKLIELGDKDCQIQTAEILLKLAVKYQPKSVTWLMGFPALELVMKKVILASDLSVSCYVCELITLILSDSNSRRFSTALSQADMLDVICDSLSTQNRDYLSSAVDCIHAMCENRGSNSSTKYGLESLLRCCLHFAHIRADEVLAKAMQTISLLLTKIKDPRLELANKTDILMFNLTRHITIQMGLEVKALQQSLQLILQFFEMKMPGAGCTVLLTEIIQGLTVKLSLSPMQQISHMQQLFLLSVRLCDKAARYITHCDTSDNTLNTPDQRRQLCATVLSAIDEALLALFERMLENEDMTADIPQAVFQLLNSLISQNSTQVQQFINQFIKSGGLILSLNLKHWDNGCQHSPITDFISQVVCYIYQQDGESVRISPQAITKIPDNSHSLLNEIFLPSDKDSLCACIDILSALYMTDQRFRSLTCRNMLELASGQYDAEIIRNMDRAHLIRLARLLASCHAELNNSQEPYLQNLPGSMKQGLSPFLLDCISQRLSSTVTLPADTDLLSWVYEVTNTSSLLSERLLLKCCEEFDGTSSPKSTILINGLMRQPHILDAFMILLLENKIQDDLAANIIDSLRTTLQSAPQEQQMVAYNILEIRCCELCLHSSDLQTDTHTSYYLNLVLSVLQAGTKRRIDSRLVKLLQKVLLSLHTDKLCSQIGVLFQNIIVTMAYHSISANDSSVACMIVNSEELRDYLNFYLKSRDETLLLSTINTLNALYSCVIKYKIPVLKPYRLSPSSLIYALDSSKPLFKLAFLQLWAAHLTCLTQDIRTCFLTYEEGEDVEVLAAGSLHGFTYAEMRIIYFYLLQDLVSKVQPVKCAAVHIIGCLRNYLTKFSPPLGAIIAENPWNQVAEAARSLPAELSSQVDSSQPLSPFLNSYGVTLLMTKELLEQPKCVVT